MIASELKIVLEGISSVVVPSVALVKRKMVAGALVTSTGVVAILSFMFGALGGVQHENVFCGVDLKMYVRYFETSGTHPCDSSECMRLPYAYTHSDI